MLGNSKSHTSPFWLYAREKHPEQYKNPAATLGTWVNLKTFVPTIVSPHHTWERGEITSNVNKTCELLLHEETIDLNFSTHERRTNVLFLRLPHLDPSPPRISGLVLFFSPIYHQKVSAVQHCHINEDIFFRISLDSSLGIFQHFK